MLKFFFTEGREDHEGFFIAGLTAKEQRSEVSAEGNEVCECFVSLFLCCSTDC
jgi:hypothetical protein